MVSWYQKNLHIPKTLALQQSFIQLEPQNSPVVAIQTTPSQIVHLCQLELWMVVTLPQHSLRLIIVVTHLLPIGVKVEDFVSQM